MNESSIVYIDKRRSMDEPVTSSFSRRRRRGSKGIKGGSNDGGPKSEATRSVTTFRPHKTLLVILTENTPTWYECGRNTPGRDDTIYSKLCDNNKVWNQQNAAVIHRYRSLANQIYDQEVLLARNHSGSTSDEQWLEGAIQKGTLKDRIAAMSVLVSSDPVHKLYALDKLLQLAGVVTNTPQSVTGEGDAATSSGHFNARINQMAAEALVDLFMNTLIPKHRKLYSLDKRPLFLYEPVTSTQSSSNQTASNHHHDKTLSARVLLLWRFEELIKAKYTSFLMQYLAKALAQNAVASLERHKILVLGTASNLLAEIPEGEHMLLTMIVNKLGDPSRKIAAAAGHKLRLVLEAHPNMTTIMAREVQQLAYRPHLTSRALYNCIIFLNQLKLTHEDHLNPQDKIHLPSSLIKTYFQLFEVAVRKSNSSENASSSTNYNIAMKGRLLCALLTGVNRTRPFLSTTNTVMEEHVEALYRIVHTSPPAAATQALMLLFHLNVGSSSDKPPKSTESDFKTSKKDRFYRALYSKLSDHSMFSGRQVTLFFNLVYKSMKNDCDPVRLVAFAKRLLHTATHMNAAVCSGSLFLLSEVGKYQPFIHESMAICRNKFTFDSTKREPRGAFIPLIDRETKSDLEVPSPHDNITHMDQTSSLWEFSLCLSHYHPTVVKFANSMTDIKYDGDPLRDVTLAHFLDKFAFRNPKSVDKVAKQLKRGESIGEKRSGIEGQLTYMSSFPVNDPVFWSQNEVDVSGSDDFFKKFFIERAKRDELKGIVRNKRDDDDDDALDMAEGKEVDFDEDDTDSDEEAFVQRLAQKLMETSGKRKSHYDEEDPDMTHWDDLDEGDDDEETMNSDSSDQNGNENDIEEEEIMNDVESEDNEDDADASIVPDHFDSEDSFNSELDNLQGSILDESIDNRKSNAKKGKLSVFAAAEDYEEMISESMCRAKRPLADVADRKVSRKKLNSRAK